MDGTVVVLSLLAVLCVGIPISVLRRGKVESDIIILSVVGIILLLLAFVLDDKTKIEVKKEQYDPLTEEIEDMDKWFNTMREDVVKQYAEKDIPTYKQFALYSTRYRYYLVRMVDEDKNNPVMEEVTQSVYRDLLTYFKDGTVSEELLAIKEGRTSYLNGGCKHTVASRGA